MAGLDVLILMGSTSDWKHLKGAVGILDRLGVSRRVHVSSAHRTPERTIELVRTAEADGCKAFICAAGMAAHLAGAVAAPTPKMTRSGRRVERRDPGGGARVSLWWCNSGKNARGNGGEGHDTCREA